MIAVIADVPAHIDNHATDRQNLFTSLTKHFECFFRILKKLLWMKSTASVTKPIYLTPRMTFTKDPFSKGNSSEPPRSLAALLFSASDAIEKCPAVRYMKPFHFTCTGSLVSVCISQERQEFASPLKQGYSVECVLK